MSSYVHPTPENKKLYIYIAGKKIGVFKPFRLLLNHVIVLPCPLGIRIRYRIEWVESQSNREGKIESELSDLQSAASFHRLSCWGSRLEHIHIPSHAPCELLEHSQHDVCMYF